MLLRDREVKKPVPKEGNRPEKKSIRQPLTQLLIKIVATVLVVWILVSFILGVRIHYGNNMFPAIRDGDLVISFRLQKPYLNSAVLYKHDGKMCCGRVVGMTDDDSPSRTITVRLTT